MANSGSGRNTPSGKRRPPGTGNRSASTRRSGAPSGARPTGPSRRSDETLAGAPTADERARERLSQRSGGGGGRGGSRGGGGRRPPSGRGRGGRGGRGSASWSTGRTAGIFGGAFVVIAVVIIVLISVLGSTSGKKVGQPIAWKPAPASYTTALANVSSAQLEAAGTSAVSASISTVFTATPKAKAITKDGKPVLVYIGAEYCPFCAASRWPMIIALDRFGTFTGLGTIASSPYDSWPNTNTFSFWKAKYSSPYLVFEPTEVTTNVCADLSGSTCVDADYKPLQSLTPLDTELLKTYESSQLSIPFLAWGGKFISAGALYDPTLINLGGTTNNPGGDPMSYSTIIDNIKSSPLTQAGQAILGTANVYSAALCEMTGGKPGSVCDSPAVKAAQTELKKA